MRRGPRPAWRQAALALVGLLASAPVWAEEGGGGFLGIPTEAWKIFNFVVFVGLLVYFLGRPLRAFFQTRQQTVASQAEEAARAQRQAAELRASMEQRVAALAAEVAALKERLHREGERERDALQRQGEEEAARLVAQVEQEADRRVADARRDLAAEAASVASDLALELLERELTAADRERIFTKTLARLERRAQGGRP
jgi:F-type H+-transporting ATPase subunit b